MWILVLLCLMYQTTLEQPFTAVQFTKPSTCAGCWSFGDEVPALILLPAYRGKQTHMCAQAGEGQKTDGTERKKGTEEGVMGLLPRGPGQPPKGESGRAVKEAKSREDRKAICAQAQRE